MTVYQAITKANELRPGGFDEEKLLMWLSELDGRIANEILSGKSCALREPFRGYQNMGNYPDTLLACEPYTDIYLYWLFMKMDFMNGETERFNNDALMYNTAWVAYANYINRTCMPDKNVRVSAG